MAVRLDIRPRFRFAADWQPGSAARRRRLPPLAVPAVAYWAAMAALTFAFTQLGPHPLDDAFAAPPAASVVPPPRSLEESRRLPEPSADPGPAAEASSRAEAPAAEETQEPTEALVTREVAPPHEEARRRSEAEPARREAPAPRSTPPAEPPRAALTFPEFTDSAPARRRERAADGPRLDSLFERAQTAPEAEPAPPPVERAPNGPVALLSCEAAVARNEERLEIGGPRGSADITREAYASILQDGSYLSSCRVPERTVLEICAAVKHGRAVGVTVSSAPADAQLSACVRRAVSRLSFPASERLDVTHTRFDAARR